MESEEQEIIEEIRIAYAKTYPNVIFNIANYLERQRVEIERLQKPCEEYIEKPFRSDIATTPRQQLEEENGALKITLQAMRDKNRLLMIALHDAINRPMGVVPASADEFYNVAMAAQAAERKT